MKRLTLNHACDRDSPTVESYPQLQGTGDDDYGTFILMKRSTEGLGGGDAIAMCERNVCQGDVEVD
ncbi:MAG: hypothetical protein RIB93_03670 [Coleofasciculus sp. D1-CHI-01]|uniref:hypothetical protein n=1 Tax=Coleofasciculus sp. D1-CHI-01 TaxID=3068482 RepID=UPI0032FF6FC5